MAAEPTHPSQFTNHFFTGLASLGRRGYLSVALRALRALV